MDLQKGPAQIVAADALKVTSNAPPIATRKVSTDHDCGKLSVLAERTQIGLLEDIIHRSGAA